MTTRVQTNARRGLRFRKSPLDGDTIGVFPAGTELEVLAHERWLRVRSQNGQIGFVSEEFVEPVTNADSRAEAGPAGQIIKYDDPIFTSENQIRIHSEFKPFMDKIKMHATATEIQVMVTSSLRRPNQPLENAIVTPARMSNHHVGYGIDVNLKFDGKFFNSNRLRRRDSLPKEIKDFFNLIRSDNMRWGGDFRTPDPVHIDFALNRNDRDHFNTLIQELWGGLA